MHERTNISLPCELTLKHTVSICIVIAVSVLVMLREVTRLPARLDAAAWFVFALGCLLVLTLEVYSWWCFGVKHTTTRFGQADAKLLLKGILASIVGGLVLEFCTLVGAPGATPFDLGAWQIHRIAIFILLSYVFFLFFCFSFLSHTHPFKRFIAHLLDVRTVCRVALIALVVVALSALATLAIVHVIHLNTFTTFFFTLALAIVGAALIVMGRKDTLCPERLFLVIALSFGMYMAAVFPTETYLSWDDQIHYDRSVSLSYGVSPEYTLADLDMTIHQLDPHFDLARPSNGAEAMVNTSQINPAWTSSSVPFDVFTPYYRQLNNAFSDGDVQGLPSGATSLGQSIISVTSVSYIPSAVGLWLGRLLHLPFVMIFDLGRIANLLAYCFVCFWAIKLIPVKKVLMCVVALIPTSLFMAASYSYDPWIISFFLLGVALVIKAMLGKDGSFHWKSQLAISAVFFVGLCPKPVYFPLMGMMLMVPRSKFQSKRSVHIYRALVVGFALLSLASFVLPFLISGTGGNDMRGGEGVNSQGQITYILSDPLGYLKMLTSFMFNLYLIPGYSQSWTTDFSYLGNGALGLPLLYVVPLLLLLGVALSDSCRQAYGIACARRKLWVVVLLGASLVVAASSLYVSFTPVGSSTIGGMQGRYLLPLVFPFVAICLCYRVTNEMNYSRYTKLALGCSSFLLAGSIGSVFVLKML